MKRQIESRTIPEQDRNRYVSAVIVSPNSHASTRSEVAKLRVVTTTATTGELNLRYAPRDIRRREEATT
jgi:hypothetical protein